MIPVIRKMSVVRQPSTNNKPMIRLSGNSFLTGAGFGVIGTAIEVSYYPDKIIINKLENQNDYKLQVSPFPTSSFSVSVDAPERLLCV